MPAFDLRMSIPDDDFTDVTKDGIDDLKILSNEEKLSSLGTISKTILEKISTICYIRGLIILLVLFNPLTQVSYLALTTWL
jgi:hypothetical protein